MSTHQNQINNSRPVKLAPLIFLCVIGLMSIFSCKKSKSVGIENEKTQEIRLTSMYQVSAKTRIFITDIETEMNQQNTTLNDYIPSNKIIDKYQIRQNGQVYWISGMIKLKENSDVKKINEMGFRIDSESKNISSIQVPLNRLDTFLNIDVIEYFEISDKLNLN
jgi:hypothetical protein